MRKAPFLFHCFSLVIGGLIYLAFRTNSLYFFRWIEQTNLEQPIQFLRDTATPYQNYIPDWVLYSLPDGLWVFSFVCLMLFIWGDTPHLKIRFWIGLLGLVLVSTEFAQLFERLPGTFDVHDLICYGLGLILPFVIFYSSHKIKSNEPNKI